MSNIDLRLGDCLEIMRGMPDASVDAVITDPPYPDYYTEEFQYNPDALGMLLNFDCKQLVFWSAKEHFPLNYTARHVWDKITGAACQYDFIYERNGGKKQKIYRGHRINSTVSAQFARDTFTGHKSQKPLALMNELIQRYTNEGDTILDPFMGSGTTGVACVQLNRNFIGIEINPQYFEIAQRRIAEAQAQMNRERKVSND